MPISFGPFAFDERNGLLSNAGIDVPLPPRVLGVLGLLLSRPGEVVSRQELLEQVWKDAYVTDTSLAEAVSFLRQALGDDTQNPRYVQTVHRRGYRFVAPVEVRESRIEDRAPRSEDRGAGLVHEPEALRPKPSIARELAPWSIAVVSLALAIVATWSIARRPAPDTLPIARFDFRPSAGSWFDRRGPALAVSRDGTTIAWSACEGATGVCGLYVRRLDRLDAVRLAGTDGAQAPFFSPDGRWIGFFAEGKLKKVPLAGGAPIALADAADAGGGSWSDDGRIVFGGEPAGGLSIASDQGGEVTPITTPQYARGELRHAWPEWLPDGSAIVFTITASPVAGAPGELAVLPWTGRPSAGRAWHVLRGGVTRAVSGGRGYLLVAGGHDVQALTFDERTLTLTGAADAVMDNLATARGVAQFAVSGAGTLFALRAAVAARTVAWGDDPRRPFPALARLSDITLSGDGRRAAGVSIDAGGSDVWTVDLASGGATRVTFGGANVSPAWTANGGLVYATRGPTGVFTVAGWPADAANVFPRSSAPDGRIAVVRVVADGRYGIGILSRGQPLQSITDGPVNETNPAFSPDGRWLAYETDASGRHEIVVRSTSGQRFVVTSDGGERPSWSADGRSIYYLAGDRLMRVPFTESTPAAGAAEVAFERPDAHVLVVTSNGHALVEQQPLTLDSAIVVLQWLRELRQKLPQPVTAPR